MTKTEAALLANAKAVCDGGDSVTRKPGRPARAGKAALERLEIRCTKRELLDLRRNARDVGMTVSALVRLRCFGDMTGIP
jgi:hypothetical protein